MQAVTVNEKGVRVAVVGATGLVGQTLLEVLAQRAFPLAELKLLASERSVGRELAFGDRRLRVQAAVPDAFEGMDFVFFAATGSLSKRLAPEAVARGAVVIDKSSSFRMDREVPLVVPEVNAGALAEHRGVVACPNCTTIGAVMALEPVRRLAGLREVILTTLQSPSGAGEEGRDEFRAQQAALRDGRPTTARVFAECLAENVVPLCAELEGDGFSSEEHKLRRESRKILGLADLPVTATCVRVPVPVGHCASIYARTERPVALADLRSALEAFPGVEVIDQPCPPRVPTPAAAAGRDAVLVGRLRLEEGGRGVWLFQAADNLRKGAALNAVQIAETLIAGSRTHAV